MNNIDYINEEYNNFILNQYIYKFIECNNYINNIISYFNLQANFIITFDSININTFNKNILYLFLIIISEIFKIIFWTNQIYILDSVLVLLTLPFLSIYILNIPIFIKICNKIKYYCYYTYYYIISKITAFTINKLYNLCFQKNININYIEFLDFFENMNDSSKYILTFTKQFISVYIIHTFKNNDNPMIKYIFTFIHKYTNAINIKKFLCVCVKLK
jgi:hypothetical protein